MRIVTLEEHFTLPAFASRVDPLVLRSRSFPYFQDLPTVIRNVQDRLKDLGSDRVAEMDRTGIAIQVVSRAAGPSADMLQGDEAVAFARDFNDAVAAEISRHPGRFAAFAHLPMTVPEAAADELQRTVEDLSFRGALVSGTVDGLFLDDPRFRPVLARAEQLDVPLYIHPGMPPEPVRRAYYDGFAPKISHGLATFGWGWHYETALHIMRLAVSGTLDRFPGLNLIIGHMGEGLPVMLARCEDIFAPDLTELSRPLSQTITDQVYITTAGFFTLPPFQAALATFGIDRLMFSVDYPYSSNDDGVKLLGQLPLAPADLQKVAHGNADRLLKLS